MPARMKISKRVYKGKQSKYIGEQLRKCELETYRMPPHAGNNSEIGAWRELVSQQLLGFEASMEMVQSTLRTFKNDLHEVKKNGEITNKVLEKHNEALDYVSYFLIFIAAAAVVLIGIVIHITLNIKN